MKQGIPCDVRYDSFRLSGILHYIIIKNNEQERLCRSCSLPVFTYPAAHLRWKISRAFFMFSRILTPNGQLGSHRPHIRQSSAVAESAQ